VFLASIPVAVFNNTLAQRIWLLTFTVTFLAGKEVMRREARDASSST
jgi:hypothetical protein